jgi:hypothetical protein
MIMIALLLLIILLGGMIFIGLMLMISYGDGQEMAAAPLVRFVQWMGETTLGILIFIAEVINGVLQNIETFLSGL